MTERPTTRKSIPFPGWVTGGAAVLVAMHLLFALAYMLGASEVEGVALDRSKDKEVYRIKGALSLEVEPASGDVSVIEVEPAFPLVRMCGAWEPSRFPMSFVEYQKGTFLYTSLLGSEGYGIVDLERRELIQIHERKPGMTAEALAQLRPFASRGLDFSEAQRVDPETAPAGLEPIGVVNESCAVFNLGFISLYVLLCLAWVVWLGVRAVRSAA